MTAFKPSPKQALFLWKMLCAEDPADREPTLGTARPRLNPKTERKPLLDAAFLRAEKRGRATHLLLTAQAWAWAATSDDVVLMRSNSRDGVIALEGLLRRLLPALRDRRLSIDDVLRPNRGAGVVPAESPASPLTSEVAERARALSAAAPTGLVRLSELRASLRDDWSDITAALIGLHDDGRLELLREDNNAAITPELRASTIQVGPEDRHLLRWRG